MNTSFNEARLAVQKARESLRNNDRSEARRWAEQAASLAPQMEDPWLILAAVASPRTSLEYVQKALTIEPDSPRANKALQWAMQRLRDTQAPDSSAQTSSNDSLVSRASHTPQSPAPVPAPVRRFDQTSLGLSQVIKSEHGSEQTSAPQNTKRSPLFPILLFGLGLLVCIAAAWSASASPVVASFLKRPAVASTHPVSWAQASIPKPTYTPAAPSDQIAALEATFIPEFQPTDVATSLPTDLSTDLPTATPADSPTVQPTEMAMDQPTATLDPTGVPTSSSDALTLSYVADTPTSAVKTSAAASSPGSVAPGTHWIDVNLTQQMVYAYSGNTVVNSFLVSTGTWQYPTVTGTYHIYVKLRYTDMSGPDYYLPNVPFTMYFYRGYGLHGTYWHHNFGTPMSHGCVNLSTPDAEWLYNFSSVGTAVTVHY
jgi:lipoprotein-anchoring transpeptidase ErfK/SrfK